MLLKDTKFVISASIQGGNYFKNIQDNKSNHSQNNYEENFQIHGPTEKLFSVVGGKKLKKPD